MNPELESPRPADRFCLLIDRGSTRVKWITALWHGLSAQWNLDVTTFGEGDVADLEQAMESGQMLPPEEVLYCSVGTERRAREVEQAVAAHTAAPVIRLRAEPQSHGVTNGYREPGQLGADRWMAIVGAVAQYHAPVLVMDLGTATTIDLVDADRRHLGGVILPGPGTMVRALGVDTELDVSGAEGFGAELRHRSGQPQGDTMSAIAGGIVSAQNGALGEALAWFKQRLGEEAAERVKVIVTGGAAGAILKQSVYQLTHDPLLVFRGMLSCRFGPGET